MTDTLVFTDVSAEQVAALGEIREAGDAKAKLAEFLGNPTDDVLSAEQRDALLDMHMYNYAFCQERSFGAKQTSVFFAVVNRVLEADFATNTEAFDVSVGRFRRLLLQHAVERSPVSVGVFSAEDVSAIVDHVTNSYYRHFNLYKYMFTPRLQVRLVQQQAGGTDAIRAPRALGDALPVGNA